MKIIICDDEYATRLLTKAYLDMYQLDIIEAINGKEALQLIESERPDLLIIDYSMPEMTGLEVIKAINKSIPSIIMTSEGFTEETEKELKDYVAGYLVKPVMPNTLAEAIEAATGEKIYHK
ncbi:response regulator [Elusimicrobiota bacterium]